MTEAAASAPAVPPEIARRRTFAIISHPDAGKTTLTEKLLLFGGAIQMAGAVKARGERRRTRSDWMQIEQQRGISVTSSVMTFERNGIVYNLLDTPGHSDFSEDTYRTLSAVDAAVMVMDAAKGIEAQTRKLFEVCRLRDIPIITFINKIDREGEDPLTLMDQIAADLALDLVPMGWPIGMGTDFRGVLDLAGKKILLPESGDRGAPYGRSEPLAELGDIRKIAGIDERIAERALEGVELAQGALPEFDLQAFREGHLSPVFFGSALKSFGVEQLLDALAAWAPGPLPRNATQRTVEPGENQVTGFVFKVQANMDPNHRDRIAFVRLCSGKFRRGMKLLHVRDNKPMAVSSPTFFFGQGRETADEAYAGDIIGVPNHGTLRVGDTLTEKGDIAFTGLPDFAPEILRRVLLGDPMKVKQMRRGLSDLAEEGVIRLFKPAIGSQWIVGVIGELQLEVLATRMEQEYGAPVAFEPSPFDVARWLRSKEPTVLKKFIEANRSRIAEDHAGTAVLLMRNAWEFDRFVDEWPNIEFAAVRERN
jgi:peptide chain release factor 3